MKPVTKIATPVVAIQPNEVCAGVHCQYSRLTKMEWSALLLYMLAADAIVVTVAWYVLNA
jgi:hypothetical protein